MRIVAGRHRGRRLKTPPAAGSGIRPSADRTREALFDILTGGRFAEGGGSAVEGRRVLDAFAGTGALGLEALSRGAVHASFLERDRAAAAVCRANIEALDEAAHSDLRLADARHPPPAPDACDLILMDPPYGQGLAEPALTALAAQGWIAGDALIVIEQDAKDAFDPPKGFLELEQRRYGRARLIFLRWTTDPA